jgi:hypothetical protein
MIEILNYNLDQSEKIRIIFDGFKENKNLLEKINYRQASISHTLEEIDKCVNDPVKTDSFSLTADIDRLGGFLDSVFTQMELVSIMLKNTKRATTNLHGLTHSLDWMFIPWNSKESLKRYLEDEV